MFSLKNIFFHRFSQFQTWNENEWIQFYFPPNFFLSLCFINEFYTWKIFFKSISWYFYFLFLLFKNVLLLCFTHDICFHWKTYSSQCHLRPEHFSFQGFIYDLKHFLSPKKNILFLFCFFKGKKSPRNVFLLLRYLVYLFFEMKMFSPPGKKNLQITFSLRSDERYTSIHGCSSRQQLHSSGRCRETSFICRINLLTESRTTTS